MRIAVAPGDDGVALIRAQQAESVVVTIDPAIDPVAKGALIAAIGPLAIERAPGGRVNAVVPEVGADPAAVEAAAAFLDAAASVTGQVLAVSA